MNGSTEAHSAGAYQKQPGCGYGLAVAWLWLWLMCSSKLHCALRELIRSTIEIQDLARACHGLAIAMAWLWLWPGCGLAVAWLWMGPPP